MALLGVIDIILRWFEGRARLSITESLSICFYWKFIGIYISVIIARNSRIIIDAVIFCMKYGLNTHSANKCMVAKCFDTQF